MKAGLAAFTLTCILILLTGCDNSPQAVQVRAQKNAARNELFIRCVDTATRNNGVNYDNSEVVEKCREAASILI